VKRASAASRKTSVELIRLNVPGVYSYPPIDKKLAFGELTLEMLEMHGILLSGLKLPASPLENKSSAEFLKNLVIKEKHITPELMSGFATNRLAQPTDEGQGSVSSDNWCGYTIVAGAPWSSASGMWTVTNSLQARYQQPATLTDVATGQQQTNYWAYVWVGLGGFTSNDVLQAGMAIIVPPNGPAQYLPYFEWFVSGFNAYKAQFPYVLPQFSTGSNSPIVPGDTIYAAVQYATMLTPGSQTPVLGGTVFIVNLTSQWYFSLFLPTPNVASIPGGAARDGSSVEWIVEQVGGLAGSLPNFQILNMSHASGAGVAGATNKFWADGNTLALTPNDQGTVSALAYVSNSIPDQVIVAYIAQPN